MAIDKIRNDLLRRLLVEYRIMAILLSKISSENITEEDV